VHILLLDWRAQGKKENCSHWLTSHVDKSLQRQLSPYTFSGLDKRHNIFSSVKKETNQQKHYEQDYEKTGGEEVFGPEDGRQSNDAQW
jgi:hypothetical protein